jgi:hypothetical protein
MRIVRKLLLAAVASFALAVAAQAPNPTPAPTFDVASVKQNKTEGTQHSSVPLDTGNVCSAINDTEPHVTGYDGRQVTAALEAIQASLASDKTVKIPALAPS